MASYATPLDVSETLRKHQEGSTRDYDIFTRDLSKADCLQSPLLYRYLKDLKAYVSLLGKEYETLVGVLLKMDWLTREPEIIKVYQSLITNLVSAHPFYLRACLRMIVKHFTPGLPGKPDEEVDEQTRSTHESGFVHLHTLLQTVVRIVPMSPKVLVPLLADYFPYMNKPAYTQQCYVSNLLLLTQYLGEHRVKVLELIVDRMTLLDVRSPRQAIQEAEPDSDEEDQEDVIFQMDEEVKERVTPPPHASSQDGGAPMSHREADKLDILMNLVLTHIYNTCHTREGELNWELTKKLYRELLQIFDRILLPTHASCHVQFVMFYICSFKEPLVEGFLDYLLKKMQNPNTQAIFRQAAVAYVASFLARANYVPVSTVKATLDVMIPWIHRYISQASIGSAPDVRHHGPFYSACQAIFYILAFRHKQLLQMPRGQKYCQSLNLQTIVTCRLNPLHFCLPLVSKTFASVARIHQLAYCDTILDRNRRILLPTASDGSGTQTHLTHLNPLDSFFPFDPYLLTRSGKHILGLYQEYEGSVVQEEEQMEEDEEEEYKKEIAISSSEGLVEGSWSLGRTPTSPQSTDLLMYGISPGFKSMV